MADERPSRETEKTTKEGLERDVSPSALSQSSTGLEWDPSADVGTSSGIHQDLSSEKTSTENPITEQEKSRSGSSSSVIWVEVEHNLEKKDDQEVKKKNVGIQTSDTESRNRNMELTETTTDFSSPFYHSTPTEPHRSQGKVLTKKTQEKKKTGKLPPKKEDSLAALEKHREYHVKKIRDELKQLENLNQMLIQSLSARKKNQSSTTTFDSSSDTTTKDSSSSGVTKKPGASAHSSKHIDASTNKRKKDKPPAQTGKREVLEQKIDKLLDTFTGIAKRIGNNKENIFVEGLRNVAMKRTSTNKPRQPKKEVIKPPIAYFVPSDEKDTASYTLQDAFQRRNPMLINQLKEREKTIARLKAEREIRAEKKRDWIRKYGEFGARLEKSLDTLPPKGPRLMTTKEMRELTEKKYKTLPEVQNKIQQRKVEEDKKTNRLMSQVFANKLQRGVLKGEVNILHSTSLIRR